MAGENGSIRRKPCSSAISPMRISQRLNSDQTRVFAVIKITWKFFSIQCSSIFEKALLFAVFAWFRLFDLVKATCSVEHWWNGIEREKAKYTY